MDEINYEANKTFLELLAYLCIMTTLAGIIFLFSQWNHWDTHFANFGKFFTAGFGGASIGSILWLVLYTRIWNAINNKNKRDLKINTISEIKE